MGRFFQAQPIQLSKDNIYQPPLELMMAANQYKNQEIQQTGENAQILLDSLDFRHQQIDDENAKNITKEISDKVNKAVEVFNKDLSSPEARRMLNSLKDEIKTRYTSGDIYNIQKTNDNLVAFEKELDNNKNLKEIDKQRHKAYFNNWIKQNPEGSLKGYFTPGNIVEDEDYIPEVIKAFKLIDPSKKATMIANLWKAGYITKNTSDVESVVREHFLKDYIEANPALKTGIYNRYQSGLYDDYDIQLTDDGNLDYTKGLLKKQVDLIRNYNYVKETIGKDYQADSNYAAIRQHNWEKEQESKSIEENYGTNTDVSDRIKKSNNIQDYRDLRVQQIVANLPENIRKKISNQKDLLKYTKGVKGLEKLHNELLELDDEIEKTAKASYDYFATKGGPEEAEKKQKEFNESVKVNHRNIRFSLAPKEVENSKIPVYGKGKDKNKIIRYEKGRQTYDSKSQYDNFYPEQTIGQIRYLPDGRKIKVTGVKFIENSAEPIIMNTPEKTGMNINYNDAKVNLQFTGNLIGNDGKVDETENGSQSFVQRAYFDMSKGVGIRQTNN